MRRWILAAAIGVAVLAAPLAALHIASAPASAQETCQSWYDPLTGHLIMVCFGE